jgi:hypothetical protein
MKNLPVAHSERAHSILGASSSHRWINCPGSVAMAEAVGTDTTTKYAAEGTVAHEVAEMALRSGLDPVVYVGKRIDGIKVTKEMALAVGVYVDKVRAMAESYGVEPMLEVQFSLAPLNPPVDMFGTADCVFPVKERKHIDVLDYKHGQGVVVEAEGNPQLLTYALGTVLEVGWKPETVTVWIVQPRAVHSDGTVREYTVTWDELVEFRHMLMRHAHACFEEDAPINVGEWCRFCPASAACPAQQEYAVATVQDAFVADAAPTLPEPEFLTDEQIDLVLATAPHITNWFRAVEKYVQGKLVEGEERPGWKLVNKRATRKWQRADKEVVKQLTGLGLSDEELWEPQVLLSPAKVEKLLRREGVDLPPDLVSKESSGYNVVPESDPRPQAVPTQLADAFTADAEASN